MRPAVLCAVMATMALIAMGAISGAEAMNQREVLMNVGTKPPSTLAEATLTIVRGLPRNGAKDTLGVIDPDSDESVDEIKKYALGLLVPIGVSIGLGLLTWASCWGFCCGRGCCNRCGKRINDRTYSSKDQRWLKVALVLLGAVCITLFALGLVSNAAISSSLDDAFVHSDRMVEHLYGVHAPLKTISTAAASSLACMTTINKTILAQMPPTGNTFKECVADMYSVVQAEQTLLAHVQPFMPSGTTGVAGGRNLTDLAEDMLAFRGKLDAVPRLSEGNTTSALQNYSLAIENAFPAPMESAAFAPSVHVSSARSLGLQGVALSTQVGTDLNPALDDVAEVVPTFLPLLEAIAISDLTSTQEEQASLLDHLVADNRSATVVDEINHLNASLAMLPPMDDFFHVSVMASYFLQEELIPAVAEALDALGALAADIEAIGDGSAYDDLLAQLESTVAAGGVPHDPSLPPMLRALSPALASLRGKTLELLGAVQSTEDAVTGIKLGKYSSDPASTAVLIRGVNASLPGVACIRPVFAQLIKLNNTVLVLPDSLVGLLDRRQQIIVQLQRLVRIQFDLNMTLSALPSIQSDLASFPAIANVTAALETLANNVQDLDSLAAAAAIEEIDGAFITLGSSASYLPTLRAAMPAFVANLTAIAPSVTSARDKLAVLQGHLAGLPEDFIDWYVYLMMVDIYGANLRTLLPQVVAQANDAAFPSQGIDSTLRSQFSSEMQLMQFVTRIPVADTIALRDLLEDVLNAGSDLRNSQGELRPNLRGLAAAAALLPDVSLVRRVTDLSYAATHAEPLGPFLNGTALEDLDEALVNFPSLDYSAHDFASAGKSLAAAHGSASSPAGLLAADLSTSTGFMSSEDLVAVYATLAATDRLATDFPDLATPIGSLDIAAGGLHDAVNSLTDYRHSYYVARQDTVKFKNHLDWLRLLGYMLVLFVPVSVVACGMYAWLKRRALASMYMGICSFSIAAILFIMAGVQLLPSMLFLDQCTDMDGFIAVNFARFSLDPSATQPWINLTAPVEATQVFDWFRACEGPRPELISAFADPAALLEQNHINFTHYKSLVEQNLAASNNTVRLQDATWALFVALDDNVKMVQAASADAYAFLNDCASSAALWGPLKDSVCSADGVSGAIALSTCLCFLFAVCMLPGVCVGVTGYKRFDPDNFGVDHLAEKNKYSGKDDPFSQGLAEQPAQRAPLEVPGVGSPSMGNRRVDSGEFDGVASPSLAVAPNSSPRPAPGQLLRAEGVELQQLRRESVVGPGNHLVIASPSNAVASNSYDLASPSAVAVELRAEGTPSPQPAAALAVAAPQHLVPQQPIVHARGGSNVPLPMTTAQPVVYEYE